MKGLLNKDIYALRLEALVSGKADKVYSSFSPQIITDYDLLKKAVLKNFCKTPDGFRMNFKSSKIQPGETYQQFSIHLNHLFEQWMEASNVASSYNHLKEFMAYDQFVSCLSPDLHMFVKEWGTLSLEKGVQMLDDLASAHNAYPKTSHSMTGNKKTQKQHIHLMPPGPVTSVRCHNCSKEGHIHPSCPKNPHM